MELAQVSNKIDTKLNSFIPGGVQKDEYEKSLYLTQAQDIFYESLLSAFENTSNMSVALTPFIQNITITTAAPTIFGGHAIQLGVVARKILRERVKVTSISHPIYDGKDLKVSEERLAEIEESLKNPFRVPNEVEALRVMMESLAFDSIELYIPPWASLTSYNAIIARVLDPLILEDLPDALTIKDQNLATADILFSDEDMDKIIDLAVNLILRDMGIVSQPQEAPQEDSQ